MPCLHNFCGGCFSDCMKVSNLCPQCRIQVKTAKYNPIINNIVTKFLNANPEKKRDKAEEDELRKKNVFKHEEIVVTR